MGPYVHLQRSCVIKEHIDMNQKKNWANCIKINELKKFNNYLINKNYKAQQLDFSINTHPMNKPINLERERVTKAAKDVDKGGIPWHQGCFSYGIIFL